MRGSLPCVCECVFKQRASALSAQNKYFCFVLWAAPFTRSMYVCVGTLHSPQPCVVAIMSLYAMILRNKKCDNSYYRSFSFTLTLAESSTERCVKTLAWWCQQATRAAVGVSTAIHDMIRTGARERVRYRMKRKPIRRNNSTANDSKSSKSSRILIPGGCS